MTKDQIESELYVLDLPDGRRFVLARDIDAATITAALLGGTEGEGDARVTVLIELPPTPICASCRFYAPRYDEHRGHLMPRCKAYPEGIPDVIYKGGFDHRDPYFGDRGVRFSLHHGNHLAFLDYLRDVDEGRFERTGLVVEGGGEGGPGPDKPRLLYPYSRTGQQRLPWGVRSADKPDEVPRLSDNRPRATKRARRRRRRYDRG